MKTSTKDKVAGKLHQVSGMVKEAVGKALDNHEMEIKGKAENMAGKLQQKAGELETIAGK